MRWTMVALRLSFQRVLMLCLILFVAACSEEVKQEVNTDPVTFNSGDECHVCGMLVLEWPGAKGQSINKQSGETLKFCSTTDLFSWWLQPENKTVQAQIYVHDMAKAHWDTPSDEHLVDAREAWYVIGSGLIGAMGPTLVSFADEAPAQELATKNGGRVLRFDDIDLLVLQEIGQAGHKYAEDHGKQIRESMGVGNSESEAE